MNAEDAIEASVIVPTHNRRDSLRRLLDALGRQAYPLSKLEVIVVADGCTDGTSATLSAYTAPYRLVAIEQAPSGPATARNAGAARARGTILIFLDDDIEPDSGLVAAHIDAHAERADVVVIGYLPPIVPQPTRFFGVALRGWWEAMFERMRTPGHRFAYDDLLSGNFSIRSEFFRRCGGFNERLWCHEDYELGLRLIELGARFVFEPRARGAHHERTDLKRALRRKFDEGVADVALSRIHPHVRGALPLARSQVWSTRLGRFSRILAFHAPALGDMLSRGGEQALIPIEWARLRRTWQRVSDGLLGYWYWRGVATQLGSERALAHLLLGNTAQPSSISPACMVDVQDGVEAAIERLDAERPESVEVRYGVTQICVIPPRPGSERLRGAHLLAAIAEYHPAQTLLVALIADAKPDAIKQSLRDRRVAGSIFGVLAADGFTGMWALPLPGLERAGRPYGVLPTDRGDVSASVIGD